MADFNINLLLAETSRYAQDFLLSLQSFSFIPTIDKPTHVHNSSSATLMDNVLANKVDANITSGNIVCDISDQYSQFCVSHIFLRRRSRENKSAEIFLVSPLLGLTLNSRMHSLNQTNFDDFDVDNAFSHFYNHRRALSRNTLLWTLSKRKLKQFSKPWMTSGLKSKKSMKVKKPLFQ